MKYYDEYDDGDKRRKKKLKHSANRPGQGMRIINIDVEDDVDTFDDFNYNYEDDDTTLNNAKIRFNTKG